MIRAALSEFDCALPATTPWSGTTSVKVQHARTPPRLDRHVVVGPQAGSRTVVPMTSSGLLTVQRRERQRAVFSPGVGPVMFRYGVGVGSPAVGWSCWLRITPFEHEGAFQGRPEAERERQQMRAMHRP